MKINIHFDDQECQWLKRFISALDHRIAHAPSQYALQALLQRINETQILELKDISLIVSLCDQNDILQDQQIKLIRVLEKHAGNWGQICATHL